MNTFKQMNLKPELLSSLEDLGFVTPTPIQEKCIPVLLNSNKNDLIALAETGTGKTAAFGLPIIQNLDLSNKDIQALIIAPTRELALQITSDLNNYAKYIKRFSIVTVYGGSSIENQIRSLKKGVQIVVATPGRAKDLIERKKLFLNNIKTLVLDEADEMLNMGFKEDLDAILDTTPEDKQVLLFSATLSKEIEKISKKYMRDTIKITSSVNTQKVKTIEHNYYIVNQKNKYEALKRIIDSIPNIYGIIFTRTRRETAEITAKLMQDGYNTEAIHGDLSQAQRENVMKKFKNKQIQLMVATDVAARGIDVNNLTHIINYNLPDQAEYYTHRSGRTGRAGKKGVSIAIINPREKGKLKIIEQQTGIAFKYKEVPSTKEVLAQRIDTWSRKISEVDCSKLPNDLLEKVSNNLAHLSKEELIAKLVTVELNSLLSDYQNSRDININDTKSYSNKTKRGQNFSRMFLNVGKKEKLVPSQLLELINNALGKYNPEVGEIEILRSFSFFEIEDKFAHKLKDAINNKSFMGRDLSIEFAKSKNGTKTSNSKTRPKRKTSKKYQNK